MKVAIVGYRNYNDYPSFEQTVNSVLKDYSVEAIVSGGCQGTDSLAERYATERNIPLICKFPDWKQYGKRAGPIRNTEIIDESDLLIAFPSHLSKGTFDSIDKAKKKGLPVITIYVD